VERSCRTEYPSPATRTLEFAITSVQYNAVFPANPSAGYFLRLDSTLSVPPTRTYATVQGQAARGTPVYRVPLEGTLDGWSVWIPYSAFNVPTGTWIQTYEGPAYQPAVSPLVAEPVLFVDNFGVKSGGLFPFYILR